MRALPHPSACDRQPPAPTARALRAHQHGFSLIEALIGFLILVLGMLGVTEMESVVIGASSDSHQRNAAVHMAQRKIEYFRAWQPGVAGKDFGDIGDGSDDGQDSAEQKLPGADDVLESTAFTREWTAVENTGSGLPRYKTVTVTVTWVGKEGSHPDVSTRQVTLQTKISAVPLGVVPVPAPPPTGS